jgi:hypothetical protein
MAVFGSPTTFFVNLSNQRRAAPPPLIVLFATAIALLLAGCGDGVDHRVLPIGDLRAEPGDAAGDGDVPLDLVTLAIDVGIGKQWIELACTSSIYAAVIMARSLAASYAPRRLSQWALIEVRRAIEARTRTWRSRAPSDTA